MQEALFGKYNAAEVPLILETSINLVNVHSRNLLLEVNSATL